MKRSLSLLMVAVLLLSATSCGIRTRVAESGTAVFASSEEPDRVPEGNDASEDAQEPGLQEPEEEKYEETEPDGESQEDADAERKEYDADASAELSEDAEENILWEDASSDVSVPQDAADGEAEDSAARAAESDVERDVTKIAPAEEGELVSAAEEGESAETVLQYYQTLLASRASDLFECKRFYVYWESGEAYRTVFKTSAEHSIILSSGAYDCSAKLLEDALDVDDGWVIRKSPGAIVKCVDSSVLGSGVMSAAGAEAVRSEILSRPGWSDIEACRAQRVVILSESLLRSSAGQTAAAVYIAKVLYPSLFEDTDPDEAFKALMLESAGQEPFGIYAYY